MPVEGLSTSLLSFKRWNQNIWQELPWTFFLPSLVKMVLHLMISLTPGLAAYEHCPTLFSPLISVVPPKKLKK